MSRPLRRAVSDATPVWKALADPTRRSILDLLRLRPRTTGELAEAFDVTRFAVMKHLTVLVEAGLVFVRRRGRERWNHLNPVPIQQIQQRWIKPFDVEPAARLLRLKHVAERAEPEGETSMTAKGGKAFRTLDIQHEVTIHAPPDRVWRALTAQSAEWWPKKFYVGKAPVAFTVEPWVGGRVFEDWGDGEGALWSTVIAVRKGELLQWVGDLPADYGGPARSITSWTLRPSGTGTVLQFRDTVSGELAAEMQPALAEGWRFLVADCFKPFVEEGKRPDRPDTVK